MGGWVPSPAMTTADRDACPRCGTGVDTETSYGIGSRGEGEELPEPTQQSKRCPNCGAMLRRAVGEAWTAVPEPWLVTARATPHDSVVREGGELIEMLIRGSSAEPSEGGLGPGRYTFEVRATDADNAREIIEAAARRQQVTIEFGDARPAG